jgi:hypothetical protein
MHVNGSEGGAATWNEARSSLIVASLQRRRPVKAVLTEAVFGAVFFGSG